MVTSIVLSTLHAVSQATIILESFRFNLWIDTLNCSTYQLQLVQYPGKFCRKRPCLFLYLEPRIGSYLNAFYFAVYLCDFILRVEVLWSCLVCIKGGASMWPIFYLDSPLIFQHSISGDFCFWKTLTRPRSFHIPKVIKLQSRHHQEISPNDSGPPGILCGGFFFIKRLSMNVKILMPN